MQKIQGFVEQGNTTLLITGAAGTISRKVQGSYPLATVTVFVSGTVTPATIYNDNIGTPKANPFTASSDGTWFFYAPNGTYDVRFSGAGIAAPFTIGGMSAFDGGLLQIDITSAPYLADPSGTRDSTVGINAAYAAAALAPNGAAVYWPTGTYLVTSQITQNGNRIWTYGAGAEATRIVFAPTANGICFQVSRGGSTETFQGGIFRISFFSSDSTYVKTALNLVGCSDFVVEDVIIRGTVVRGTTSYWSDNSNSSIGLQTNGHETNSFNRISIAADRPVFIGLNSVNAIDCDHYDFNDCNLTANQNPIYECVANCWIQHLNIGGYQAWVKGTDGFKLICNGTGRAVGARPMIRIENIGREQVQDTSHHCINIQMSGGDSIQLLMLRNMYGPTINEGHGLILRGIFGAIMESVWYIGNAVALDVDASDACFWLLNCFFTANGGTIANAGMTGFTYWQPGTGKLSLNTFDTGGMINLRNDDFLNGLSTGGVSTRLIGMADTGLVSIGPDGGPAYIGGPLRISNLAPLSHRVSIPNGQHYSAVNAAGTDTVSIAAVGGDDRVVIDGNFKGTVINGQLQVNTGLTLQGGGAAALLGTVGGSGPATATQSVWQKLILSNGQAYWIPMWQ